MNYIELIALIEKRPKFFLRNQNLEELTAFLGGISYVNFTQENNDQFRDFWQNWFPRTFPECTHDWLTTLKEMARNKDEWQLFFEIWNRYVYEKNNCL